MSQSFGQSTVEELNEALRLYRRLLFRLVAIFVLGLAGCWGLNQLGTYLSPPYGVYIFGESLATWGLLAVVGLLIAELWWEGRQVGRALNDPVLMASPVAGLMSGLSVIAQRAQAMGMTWSGFLGNLRPVRNG